MNLEKTVSNINRNRSKIEASFIFCLWKNPELYEIYKGIKEDFFEREESKYYFSLGENMYKTGIRKFDNISIDSYISDKEEIKRIFSEYGGFDTVESLISLVNIENVEAYFDDISKKNSLCLYAKKIDNLFENVDKFQNATNEDIYNTFELLNNTIALKTNFNEKIEDISIDDSDIEYLNNGNCVGFNYGKYSPILNYITLGVSDSNLYMIAGHSGIGKTSFTIENMIFGLHYTKTAIISNEMKIDAYKILLLEHILTRDLNYYGLTRKAIKKGSYNKEQLEMLKKASQISKDKYSDIKFVKVFDNNIGKIIKYLRKFKTQGISVILYDTFKVDDTVNNNPQTWQTLLMDSRKLFQECSKLSIGCITTFQLALHTLNQRYLDAQALANAKQVKEVYETMVYMRELWSDEYTGEPHDVKAYSIQNGVRKAITLNPNEKYILFFIDKTRSDEDKQVLIYQVRKRFNEWKEIGFANVENTHTI